MAARPLRPRPWTRRPSRPSAPSPARTGTGNSPCASAGSRPLSAPHGARRRATSASSSTRARRRSPSPRLRAWAPTGGTASSSRGEPEAPASWAPSASPSAPRALPNRRRPPCTRTAPDAGPAWKRARRELSARGSAPISGFASNHGRLAREISRLPFGRSGATAYTAATPASGHVPCVAERKPGQQRQLENWAREFPFPSYYGRPRQSSRPLSGEARSACLGSTRTS
jgi:hypothetical protein